MFTANPMADRIFPCVPLKHTIHPPALLLILYISITIQDSNPSTQSSHYTRFVHQFTSNNSFFVFVPFTYTRDVVVVFSLSVMMRICKFPSSHYSRIYSNSIQDATHSRFITRIHTPTMSSFSMKKKEITRSQGFTTQPLHTTQSSLCSNQIHSTAGSCLSRTTSLASIRSTLLPDDGWLGIRKNKLLPATHNNTTLYTSIDQFHSLIYVPCMSLHVQLFHTQNT